MNQTLKKGIIIGLISAAWLLGGFSILKIIFPSCPQSILRTSTGLLSMVILFIGITSGISNAKKARAEKFFAYGDAVKTGIFISIIVAVIVSLASLLYVTVLNPSISQDMAKETEMALKKTNLSQSDISMKLDAIRHEFSVRSQVLIPLIAQFTAGTIFSLILGLFFRTKK